MGGFSSCSRRLMASPLGRRRSAARYRTGSRGLRFTWAAGGWVVAVREGDADPAPVLVVEEA
jgi:hypothetical protein